MAILNGLNREQRKAVLHKEGPLLILAGAGSGKTKALTHRVAYLIKKREVHPSRLLVTTFTNKAAEELAVRVSKLLAVSHQTPNTKYHLPWLGTFHSNCVKILRREINHLGYENTFLIYDQIDSLRLIKKVMKKLTLDCKDFIPQAIRAYISRAKNELINEEVYQNYIKSEFEEKVSKVYREYQRALKEAKALDFDDLIMKTVELFQKNKLVLEKYRRFFEHILVDEYQDTNQAQYVLIRLLAAERGNLSVVGDDWQSIYKFRGADYRNILNFKKDYDKVKIIKLEQNYRSTKNILAAAQAIIEKNRQRSEKKLWTFAEKGDKVAIKEILNAEAEAEEVIQEIIRLISSSDSRFVLESNKAPNQRRNDDGLAKVLKNSVVLYRTHAQSRVLEEKLLDYQIPYRIFGGVRFYERKEIKDIVAYLRVVARNDTASLERIANVPPRGIGEKRFKLLLSYYSSPEKIGTVESGSSKKSNSLRTTSIRTIKDSGQIIQRFLNLIKDLKKKSKEKNIVDFLRYLIKKTGYKEYLLDGTEEGEARWENVQELISVASKYAYISPGESLRNFLDEVSLMTNIDNYDENKPVLTLMTLHNAKGLEFDNVFMVGMEEGIFPHARSLTDEAELEEERRLCYVGMTRARKRLYMFYASERLMYGGIQANPPSRFIEEIPKRFTDCSRTTKEFRAGEKQTKVLKDIESISEVDGTYLGDGEESQVPDIDYRIGDEVQHSHFGKGRVVALNDDEVVVLFSKAGKKKLSTFYAKMGKIK